MGRPITNRTKSSGGDERLYFPLVGFPHGIQLIFKHYDFSGLTLVTNAAGKKTQLKTEFTSAKETGILAVELPMPTTLTDATGLQVNGFERTFLEAFIADTLAPAFTGGIGEIGKDLMALGEAGAKGAFDAVFGEKDLTEKQTPVAGQAARIAAYMGRNALNSFSSGLGKSMGATSGTAINPQATLSFEGVNLRTFSFDWTLYPESIEEAFAIKKIIRSIKRNILPEVQGVSEVLPNVETLSSNSLARAFLVYPAVVCINLLGSDESHFPQFTPCMVDNINIDYGASGEIIIAEGGVPQGVKLSMTFKELEIQTAHDYEGDDV
jgi:hypothetical protein